MKPTTSPTLTSAALFAPRQRLSNFFIANTRRLLAAGRGTATALSADAPHAAITALALRRPATLGFARGGGRILLRPRGWTRKHASKASTASQRRTWRKCAPLKRGAALSASAQRHDFSLITVIQVAGSDPFCARPATLSLAGTRRRPIRSSLFRNTSRSIRSAKNADVLLELANSEARGLACATTPIQAPTGSERVALKNPSPKEQGDG